MLRRLIPLSRLGLAMWAWSHRDTIVDWAQFAARSATSIGRGGSMADATTELRLRTSLAADKRTRNEPLTVHVTDGVARISGRGTATARDAAVELARRTKGVHRVHESVEVPHRRRRFAFA